MTTEPDPQPDWLAGFLQGDPALVRDFWTRYGPMLERVAASHIGERLRAKLGAEDVVQSACRTFFRRAKAGEFRLEDAEALWRLLCAITVTKVKEQARFHTRKKRSLDREVPATDSQGAAIPIPAAGPAPEAEVEFADSFQNLLESLNEEERAIVDLKLQDLTHDEVAERMGISERTVRRLFKQLERKLSTALGAPTSDSE